MGREIFDLCIHIRKQFKVLMDIIECFSRGIEIERDHPGPGVGCANEPGVAA
jgi:hypothetical protein